jgi:hypothetical protein
MEDDLNIFENKDDPKFLEMEDNPNFALGNLGS